MLHTHPITTSVILGLSLTLCSFDLNQIMLFYQLINCSSLHMTKQFQASFSIVFSSIGATIIFKKISSFHILYFLVFSLINLNILISTTLILQTCCFLIPQQFCIYIYIKKIKLYKTFL